MRLPRCQKAGLVHSSIATPHCSAAAALLPLPLACLQAWPVVLARCCRTHQIVQALCCTHVTHSTGAAVAALLSCGHSEHAVNNTYCCLCHSPGASARRCHDAVMILIRLRDNNSRTGDAPTAGWSGICECGLCRTSPTCWATRSPARLDASLGEQSRPSRLAPPQTTR